jgi:K+-sensing histidine kinase KdpD
MAALMNEPARKAGSRAGGRIRPQRIAGPVVAGVVPGQPPAVVQSAARLAYSLNVKLICAYVDITSYLSNERDDQDLLQLAGQDGTVDDAEQASAHLREHLQAVLGKAGIRWSLLTLVGEPARRWPGWRIRRMPRSLWWARAKAGWARGWSSCCSARWPAT